MKKIFEQKKAALVSGMSSNKGFSLVELIIVVAIMAVLMGVLAPQYLRFVESSREQADESALNEVVKVTNIAIATMGSTPIGATVTWEGTGGTIDVDYSADTTAEAALQKEIDMTIAAMGKAASAKYANKAIVFEIDSNSNGVPYIFVASSTVTSFEDGYTDHVEEIAAKLGVYAAQQ